MKNKLSWFTGIAIFTASGLSQAQTVIPQWTCKDIINNPQTQITVDVQVSFDNVSPFHQMMIHVLETDTTIPEKHFGPYLLLPQKPRPMVGTQEFRGADMSFYLGTGEDKDHIFGQIIGKLEGHPFQVILNCKDLRPLKK